MQVQIIGMAWFKPENFLRLRTMFVDGHKLHRTYPEWLKAAQTGYESFKAQGARVIKVDIDPDTFTKWCKSKGMRLDAQARMAYANFVAYQIATGDQSGNNGVH